ncbi:MAG: hypothetical protein CVU65_08340 [Deltaproteobacteria bacterium HGW-Deltaproteobacteria-22]|jgi:hypothetical protein|nr:MAG: hypothetical protein CVU65_08340 [Deltaproteobacteria bacterium HGW-Deltaproteobacteria-22]
MKLIAWTLTCSWFVLGTVLGGAGAGCGGGGGGNSDDGGGWEDLASRLRSLIPDPGLPGVGAPRPGQVTDLSATPEDRDLDYTFPDTLCGNLVQRLLECETERIRNQPNLRDNEKLSVISNKRRTFAKKRGQYLSHCQKKVSGLPEAGVRSCLPLPCVEMDRCLQKISGQTSPK